MGLGIFAYSYLTLCSPEKAALYASNVDPPSQVVHVRAEVPEYVPRLGSMTPGYYEHTTATLTAHFHVGSYSWYSWWRNQLSRLALGAEASEVWRVPSQYQSEFYELIHFSDAEGTLGPETCAKLHTDFVQNKARLQGLATARLGEEANEFMECYAGWERMLALGAQGGCVQFH